MTQFRRGDWVKWVGGSYHNLVGIVVDTREGHNSEGTERHEVKVIWDGKGLGSLKQKAEGSWQREGCLKVLSRVEQNDENE